MFPPHRLISRRGAALRGFSLLPGPLTGEAVVQADARLPAEVCAEFGGVRERVPLIAGAGRLLSDDCLSSCQFFQLLDDVPNGGGFAAADVVDLARVSRNGGDCRAHAIGDVGVAADLLAVAVNGYRLLPLHRADEDVISHVRP